MAPPLITFLSDYGLEDHFVGVCHGVIAGICPSARVIDITHGIPRHDVRRGAIVLASALERLPVGVHLAVVDPEVGARRRAVAVRAADARLLVGPDNGLLAPALAQSGGAVEAVDIAYSHHRLEPVSATFHGRDLFAPVAGHLAAGEPLSALGAPMEPEALVGLELPRAEVREGALLAHTLYIDRFGNVGLDANHEDIVAGGLRLGRRLQLGVAGKSLQAVFARTFADVEPGQLLLYEDSDGRLAIAISHGSAAQRLGLGLDDDVVVRLA